jgi:hypothetical protein
MPVVSIVAKLYLRQNGFGRPGHLASRDGSDAQSAERIGLFANLRERVTILLRETN